MSEFTYRYVEGKGEPERSGVTLLLLHGTGGDESDLLGVGAAVLPGAALLSPRGKVLENGMPRFFRRFAEGVFDVEDVKARAAELGEFVRAMAGEHGFDLDRVVALGFSNGANIAAAMLLTGALKPKRSVLIRAMAPLQREEIEGLPDLTGREVLMESGLYDAVAPAGQTRQLREMLEEFGAGVWVHEERSGHQMTQGDIATARTWLARPL
jgi:predicted esterase